MDHRNCGRCSSWQPSFAGQVFLRLRFLAHFRLVGSVIWDLLQLGREHRNFVGLGFEVAFHAKPGYMRPCPPVTAACPKARPGPQPQKVVKVCLRGLEWLTRTSKRQGGTKVRPSSYTIPVPGTPPMTARGSCLASSGVFQASEFKD